MQRPLFAVLLILTVSVPLVGACANARQSEPDTRVSGAVIYRERMALPPEAVVVVTLKQRLPDGQTLPVTEVRVPAKGRSVPLPFEFRFPGVSGTGPYVLEARIQTGDEVLFATPEPVCVEGDGAPVTLLTHRVMSGDNASAVPDKAATPDEEFAGVRWKLDEVDGRKAELFVDQAEPHLIFNPEGGGKGRLSGSDGCNRFAGAYTLKGTSLHFSGMASTLMLCPFGEVQTRAFNQALHNTTNWRIRGGKLELRAGKKVLAVLERAPLL